MWINNMCGNRQQPSGSSGISIVYNKHEQIFFEHIVLPKWCWATKIEIEKPIESQPLEWEITNAWTFIFTHTLYIYWNMLQIDVNRNNTKMRCVVFVLCRCFAASSSMFIWHFFHLYCFFLLLLLLHLCCRFRHWKFFYIF